MLQYSRLHLAIAFGKRNDEDNLPRTKSTPLMDKDRQIN
jgi:hypothetical protein